MADSSGFRFHNHHHYPRSDAYLLWLMVGSTESDILLRALNVDQMASPAHGEVRKEECPENLRLP